MVSSDTNSRYKKQLLFSLFVVAISLLLYFSLHPTFDSQKTTILFDLIAVITFLIIWHLGIPMPYIGLVSMERSIQFFLLLTIDYHQAAVINAIAAFIWPFTNKKYSQSSFKLSALKSMHNSGMVAIMMLVTGFLLSKMLSEFPVLNLTEHVVFALLLSSVSIQILNFSILGTFYRLDGKKVSELFSPINLVIELIFVPLGILAAVLYNKSEVGLFIILMVFTLVVLIAFYSNAFTQKGKMDLIQIKNIGYDHNNLKSVVSDLANNIKNLLHFDSFYVAMLNDDENELEVIYQTHKQSRKPLKLFIHEVEKAIELKSLYSNNNLHIDNNEDKSILIAPLINHEGVYGVISLMSNSINAYSVSDSGIVKDIAYKYSMILSYARAYEILEHHSQTLENLVNKRTNELKRANSEKQQLLDELTKKSLRLKQLSEHDYLTGLFNRRYFNQIISELNSTVDISIALIDLDHFKKVNDTYGHSIGDEVLIQVANTMKTVFSENVTIARYGGEEFVVLFDNVVFSRVNNLCELFRASVQSYNWNSIVPNLKLTVSLGVESSTTKQDIKSIIDQADQNLYKAKELGRNQIVISRDSITSKI